MDPNEWTQSGHEREGGERRKAKNAVGQAEPLLKTSVVCVKIFGMTVI